MADFYDFLTGPALWAALIIFVGGLVIRAAFLFGLSQGRDRVFWDHFNVVWGLKSIFHWLIPLGSLSFKNQPAFGLAFWVMHLCMLLTPFFLSAHNLLFEEAYGWSLWSLPDGLADVMTWLVIICLGFMLWRRVAKPEVRILSTGWDYFLLLLTCAPFLTGTLAYHQVGDYQFMLVLHILCSELLLIVIPFSKLGHLVLFFFTRVAIAAEMGSRRDLEGREGAKVW